VNEEGTEAAAVTSVEMTLESAGPTIITMRMDRPFIFVIRENHSGSILFAGKIINPVS
jgi:serpin B